MKARALCKDIASIDNETLFQLTAITWTWLAEIKRQVFGLKDQLLASWELNSIDEQSKNIWRVLNWGYKITRLLAPYLTDSKTRNDDEYDHEDDDDDNDDDSNNNNNF